MKVLFGPYNVADQAPALAEAMRGFGIRANVYSTAPHPFFPPVDLQDHQTSRLGMLKAARRFFRLAAQYDVVHLQSAAFLPATPVFLPRALEPAYLAAVVRMIDILRRRGIVVAITLHGSEARPLAEIEQHWDHADDVLALDSHEPTARSRRVRYSLAVAGACDLVFVTTPDLLPLAPRSLLTPVVPSRAFSSVLGEARSALPPARRGGEPLRVLHAPSETTIKGTRHIEAAVRQAQAQGLPIDLRLITGRPTAEVVRAVLDSHLTIDQVNFGWYSAFAVESMALARPAIARIEPAYAALFDAATERAYADQSLGPLPSSAESLVHVLGDLYRADADQWRVLSANALATYQQIHRPELVARQLLNQYARVLRP